MCDSNCKNCVYEYVCYWSELPFIDDETNNEDIPVNEDLIDIDYEMDNYGFVNNILNQK